MSLLPDATQFVDMIKRVAIAAVDSKKPVEVVYGKVLSTVPLSVRLDQKRILSGFFLKRLDFAATVSVEGASAAVSEFSAGDTVAMLRVQGGKEYLILGRAV